MKSKINNLFLTCLFLIFFSPEAQSAIKKNFSLMDIFKKPQMAIQDQLNYAEFWHPEPELKRSISFWIKVFALWESNTLILHDEKYPHIVFQIITFTNQKNLSQIPKKRWNKYIRPILQASKSKYRKILEKISKIKNEDKLVGKNEKRIYRLYHEMDDPNKFKRIKYRFRVQHGMKDAFQRALLRSGKYLSIMESVFRQKRLPIELTRIPFIESMFQNSAASKVGAVGIWQIMPKTAKFFGLKINFFIDERLDPIVSTDSVSKIFKKYYKRLNNWGLVITAYNHGVTAIAKGKRKYNFINYTNLIKKYRNPRFGFASRNFYPEFLAALYVEKYSKKYFGDINRKDPIEYHEIILTKKIRKKTIISKIGKYLLEFKNLNPSIKKSFYQKKKYFPKNFVLKIPKKAFLLKKIASGKSF